MNYKLAEGTPKLEEVLLQICACQCEGADSRGCVLHNNDFEWRKRIVRAILRPFITPACSPPNVKEIACDMANELMKENRERHKVDHCWPGIVYLSEKIEKAIKLATPASTGEAGLLEAWRWLQNQIAGILAGKSARNFDETMAAMDLAVRRVSTGEANGQQLKDIRAALDDALNYLRTEQYGNVGVFIKQAMFYAAPTSVPQAEPPKEESK